MENWGSSVGGRRYLFDMRWDHLFDDLAGQLEHELQSEETDLQQEEERLRLGRLSLRDRLVALRGRSGSPEFESAMSSVSCRLRSGEVERVRLVTIGRDWLAGDREGNAARQQVIVPFAAVDSLLLTAEQAQASLGAVAERSELAARLGVSFLLRDLCRRRTVVSVRTFTAEITGTIDRVGRDHVDLAVHDREVPRRSREVDHVRVIPIEQILLVRL